MSSNARIVLTGFYVGGVSFMLYVGWSLFSAINEMVARIPVVVR